MNDLNDMARAGTLPASPRDATVPINGKARAKDRKRENVVEGQFWRKGLILTRDGDPKKCLANVMHVFSMHPDWQGVIAWDAFGVAVVTQKRPPMRKQDAPVDYAIGDWTDDDTSRTAAWFASEVEFEPAPTHVDQAVQAVAHKTIVHPVRDWLSELAWDGTPRLDMMAVTYLGAVQSRYSAAVCRRWMIAAVARVFEPGAKVDSLLGLEGAQGIGKSSALRLLAGPAWFADTGITIGDKDSYQALRRKWIYEFAELASIRGREIERVKNFLSSQVDTFRPSYGKRTYDHPRQVVFAGSTNEEQYLADPSGSRRFWPLRCHNVDLDALKADRSQLWAEAVAAYKAGEPWHLDTPELRALAAEEAAEREEHDDWKDIVARWLEHPSRPCGKGERELLDVGEGVSTGDVLLGALGFPAERITPAATKRAGHVLRALRLHRRQVRVGHDREWRYFRVTAPAEDAQPVTPIGDNDSAETGFSHHVTSVCVRACVGGGPQDTGGPTGILEKQLVTPVTGDNEDDLERQAIMFEGES